MKLPDLEHARVPKDKIVNYLLSPTHPAGGGKARWFMRVGFSVKRWQQLAAALKDHAANHDLTRTEESPYGIRYIIEGPLDAPDGSRPAARSVWFVETGHQTPRFVTAYPIPRSGP